MHSFYGSVSMPDKPDLFNKNKNGEVLMNVSCRNNSLNAKDLSALFWWTVPRDTVAHAPVSVRCVWRVGINFQVSTHTSLRHRAGRK